MRMCKTSFAKRYINIEHYSIPSSLGGTSDYNTKHGMVIVGGAICVGAPVCPDYREVHLLVVQGWVDLDLGQSGILPNCKASSACPS